MVTKVTIINETNWQTRHLRSIAVRAIKGYYDHRYLRITFVSARYRHSGCAWLNSGDCVIRVPSKPRTMTLAALIAHEAAHCAGITHQQMRDSYRELQWGPTWKDRFQWAANMPLEQKPRKVKKPKPTGLELAAKRHANAMRKLTEWETKRKSASRYEKKYRDKVRYYERRMAALREKP